MANLALDEYGQEMAANDRRRRLAEQLGMGAMEPIQQQTVGDRVVPVHPLQALAKVFQGYIGGRNMADADERQKELSASRNRELAAALAGMPQARTETVDNWSGEGLNEINQPTQRTVQPTMAENASWLGSLARLGPDAMSVGSSVLGMQQRALEGQETRAARLQERVLALDAAAQNAALSREERAQRAQEAATLRREMMESQQTFAARQAEAQRAFQSQLAEQNNAARRDLAQLTAGIQSSNRTPVAVMGPNGPVFVPPSQAVGMTPAAMDTGLQGRLSGSKAAGKVTGEGQAEAEMGLGGAIAKADQALNLIDQMVGSDPTQLRPGQQAIQQHPGFQSVVGATMLPGARLIPGTDAADFDKLLDQVKGGAFLQAFEALKGGGAITQIEGTKATDAITRMNRSQSEAEFVKAAREFQSVIRSGVERARQRASMPVGAPNSAPSLSPAESQELQQLRQRFRDRRGSNG